MIRKGLAALLISLSILIIGCEFGQPGDTSALANCMDENGWNDIKCGKYSEIADRMFLSYSFQGITDQDTVINPKLQTITVTVPEDTNVASLVAVFTKSDYCNVKIGSTYQYSGSTTNDFTSPVTYNLSDIMDSSSSTLYWTVTVVRKSAKAITSFSINGYSGIINETIKTISVTLPTGTITTALVATFTTTGSSVKVGTTEQVSGSTANNFTSPVTYKVTAIDNSYVNYTVSVTIQSISIPASIGKWLFTGNANDTSGNGFNGTVTGATLTTDRFGISNRAYNFNGTNNYITLPNLGISGSQARTLSCWIYTRTISAYQCIFIHGALSTASAFSVVSNGTTQGDIYVTAFHSNVITPSNLVSINTWTHIVIKYNGNSVLNTSSCSIYINNVLANSYNADTITNILNTPDTNYFLGRSIDGGSLFNGYIDDVRIYNRALTVAEIDALYHEGEWNP